MQCNAILLPRRALPNTILLSRSLSPCAPRCVTARTADHRLCALRTCVIEGRLRRLPWTSPSSSLLSCKGSSSRERPTVLSRNFPSAQPCPQSPAIGSGLFCCVIVAALPCFKVLCAAPRFSYLTNRKPSANAELSGQGLGFRRDVAPRSAAAERRKRRGEERRGKTINAKGAVANPLLKMDTFRRARDLGARDNGDDKDEEEYLARDVVLVRCSCVCLAWRGQASER